MLRIELRELFEGDRVEVWVGGQRAAVEDDVRTRLQIGRARSVEIPLPSDPARVEVRLPERGLRAGLEVDSRRTPYLAVDLSPEGGLQLTPSEQPFGFL